NDFSTPGFIPTNKTVKAKNTKYIKIFFGSLISPLCKDGLTLIFLNIKYITAVTIINSYTIKRKASSYDDANGGTADLPPYKPEYTIRLGKTIYLVKETAVKTVKNIFVFLNRTGEINKMNTIP